MATTSHEPRLTDREPVKAIVLRFPDSVHAALCRLRGETRRSINEYVNRIVADELRRRGMLR